MPVEVVQRFKGAADDAVFEFFGLVHVVIMQDREFAFLEDRILVRVQ